MQYPGNLISISQELLIRDSRCRGHLSIQVSRRNTKVVRSGSAIIQGTVLIQGALDHCTLCATPLHPYLGKAKVSDPLETQSPAADHPPSRGPFPNFPLPHQRFRNQKTTSSPLRLLSAAERCLRLTTPVDASQHPLPHSPVIKRRFIRFCICPGRDAFTFPTGFGTLP